MKCIVIYFSQTCSTEAVAKAIQKGIKKAAGNCDLIKIRDANPRRLYDYDLIGLGSRCPADINFVASGHGDLKLSGGKLIGAGVPLGGNIPMNVELFIKDIRFVGGKHAFTFNTHGSIPEYFFPTIVPMLKSRNLIVIGWKGWYGNAYLPWHAEPYPTAGHPDEIDLREAESFGSEMVQRSTRISAGEVELIPSVPDMPPPMRKPDNPAWDLNHWYFKFHKEKCLYPKCRLCMENCPVDGIDLSIETPVFAVPCQKNCSFCTMICPTGALENDEYEKQTTNHLRLQKEIVLPRLAKQESERLFRRLLPVEKVGIDTSYSMIYKKHPRWIIGKGPGLK